MIRILVAVNTGGPNDPLGLGKPYVSTVPPRVGEKVVLPVIGKVKVTDVIWRFDQKWGPGDADVDVYTEDVDLTKEELTQLDSDGWQDTSRT